MTLLSTYLHDAILSFVFLVILVIVYASANAILKARRTITDFGTAAQPSKTDYPGVFLIMAGAAISAVYLLWYGLTNNIGMLNYILFAIFPYLSLVIFLIGSVYRYRNRGFQVSSLSSEFLERKKLFWGSQPFHWGLLVLFFGHLIAFLFPSSVLAWNGSPVRLVILETTAFVFGLSALIGLVLLIKRRLGSDRVLVVTNKMDMLVYVTLLTQIISGLGVAYFNRWGSSWFAAVLTPYLRSVLAFNPDINAVSVMPWSVQIHIFSAFFIIAIIPFTRFIHFLVAPIDYIWRRYQLVIWNWSRKSIRNSSSYYFGKKSGNH
ncbi:MAG: respiratory nitrate reductase subunit gamma [Flavobacteriales bacterium]|nr:respiratory nitrate reductase subunit gamma [Flavobacteriales bacterium]MCB9447314.1 respiratory nitrate reductase subunit gamma [Flavobacteriales bacterium]